MLDGARVKVCDLGQAKFFNVLDRQTAAPGAVVYAAPEVGTAPCVAVSMCMLAGGCVGVCVRQR